MKKLFFLAALLFFSNFLFAQDEGSHKAKGVIGYFRAGYSMLNFSSLNDAFKIGNMQLPNTLTFSTGGGGFVIHKSFLIGGEGYGFMNSKTSNVAYESKLDGGKGSLQLGYVVFRRTKITVIPTVGIGGYKVSADIRSILPDSTNFNQVLFNPNNSTHLQTSGISIAPKIIFEIKAFKLIHVGIEAGYDYALMNKGWTSNGQKIKEGPTTNLNGLFFGLTIGAGFIGD